MCPGFLLDERGEPTIPNGSRFSSLFSSLEAFRGGIPITLITPIIPANR